MSAYDAVLFDLDGTLVDSLIDIASAMNRTLERRGCPTHPVEAYRVFVGEGVEKLAERALPADRQDLRASVIQDYRADYATHALEATTLYPAIAQLLDQLTARHIKLGILSNKPDLPTRALAEALLSRWRFGAIFGERAGVPRKPAPQAAWELAGKLGVTPERCLFVGDTAIDMKTAVAAGMTGVGVRWGFREHELLPNGAKRVIGHPLEVLELLA